MWKMPRLAESPKNVTWPVMFPCNKIKGLVNTQKNSFFSNWFFPLDSSFWPFLLGSGLLSLVTLFVAYLGKLGRFFEVILGVVNVILILLSWWKDLVRESILGFHSAKLELRIRSGMILFITREVFFFFRFFWCFFDAAVSPAIEYGIMWPPKGILGINPYSVPLLNTVILIRRGVRVTWAHHCLLSRDFNGGCLRLLLTVSLGVYFLITQVLEYNSTRFSISDGVFGAIFFLLTGFHGCHVIIGTLFLTYILYIMANGLLISNHHFSFEAAAWYWHFVDVVWIFLFVVIYIIFR